ncbi:MAG: Crp/Fnr family transcriptional regulator [Saprospiraceae bacterium]
MSYSLILANIQKHIDLNEEEIEYFISLLNQKEIRKKEFVLQQGDTCRNIFFITKGGLRAFYINQNGKKSTIMFAIKDWWITDMNCFLNQIPAMSNIVALENSSLLQLSFFQLQKLYQRVPKFERFFRILMEKAYVREQLRALDNLTLTAVERYDKFVEKYPKINEQITQKQLASYLGISPEFLSTIKKNKLDS